MKIIIWSFFEKTSEKMELQLTMTRIRGTLRAELCKYRKIYENI